MGTGRKWLGWREGASFDGLRTNGFLNLGESHLCFPLVQSTRTASGRPKADLFTDRSGEAAGGHEPVPWSPARVGRPNRGPGVRRSEAGQKINRPLALRKTIVRYYSSSRRMVIGIFVFMDC